MLTALALGVLAEWLAGATMPDPAVELETGAVPAAGLVAGAAERWSAARCPADRCEEPQPANATASSTAPAIDVLASMCERTPHGLRPSLLSGRAQHSQPVGRPRAVERRPAVVLFDDAGFRTLSLSLVAEEDLLASA